MTKPKLGTKRPNPRRDSAKEGSEGSARTENDTDKERRLHEEEQDLGQPRRGLRRLVHEEHIRPAKIIEILPVRHSVETPIHLAASEPGRELRQQRTRRQITQFNKRITHDIGVRGAAREDEMARAGRTENIVSGMSTRTTR